MGLSNLPVVTRFFWPPEMPRTKLSPTKVSWQTCDNHPLSSRRTWMHTQTLRHGPKPGRPWDAKLLHADAGCELQTGARQATQALHRTGR